MALALLPFDGEDAALSASGERPIARESGIRFARRGPAPLRTMDVFGVPVAVASRTDVHDWLSEAVAARGRAARVVHFVDARSLARTWHDASQRLTLSRADLVLSAGATVEAYAKLAAAPWHPHFDAVTTLDDLFAGADPRNPIRVYITGCRPGTSARVAQAIDARYDGARVVVAADGFADAEDINEACADLVLVGSRSGPAWLEENAELLDVGVAVSVGDALARLAGLDAEEASPRDRAPMGFFAALAFLAHALAYLALRMAPPAFR